MLLTILLVILVLDCIALVAVVLLQRSEGGALGMGGGSQSMFTARGAGDLLTRTTWILAWVFFGLAFGITLLSGITQRASVVDSLEPGGLVPLAVPTAPGDQAPPQGAPGAPDSAPPPLPGSAPAPEAAPPLPQSAPRPGAAPRTAAQRPAASPPASAPTTAPAPTVTLPSAAPAPAPATPPSQTP